MQHTSIIAGAKTALQISETCQTLPQTVQNSRSRTSITFTPAKVSGSGRFTAVTAAHKFSAFHGSPRRNKGSWPYAKTHGTHHISYEDFWNKIYSPPPTFRGGLIRRRINNSGLLLLRYVFIRQIRAIKARDAPVINFESGSQIWEWVIGQNLKAGLIFTCV